MTEMIKLKPEVLTIRSDKSQGCRSGRHVRQGVSLMSGLPAVCQRRAGDGARLPAEDGAEQYFEGYPTDYGPLKTE